MSSAEQAAFVGALCWHVPELLPLMQENLDDYDALLPHLLMGEVTRWVVEHFTDDSADSSVRKVLDFAEQSFERGSLTGARELIGVSFLENLPRPGEAGCEVADYLGPNLREQIKLLDSRYR